ncbi:hypothetical protein BT96DRAFT_942164 [Gymnopus androsaceus JB14]|uniref:MYND-type domain-containing protein n=1 Tax=Gymnopus androsaceus JB14 TaxID=1447944 RepID=A0A6A4HF69_9AGAR|nr:hypothetical protein BT96DRAFT_942164 [Gymnopus androsaceus JB14]
MSTYCNNCRAKASCTRYKKCSNCKTVSYCTERCQADHWPVHQPLCKPYDPNVVWGIRILSNNGVTKLKKLPMNFFQHEMISDPDHPIYREGEQCPVTERCGIPLIIYKVPNSTGPNEISVKLRIEASNGYAPPAWQVWDLGECIVVREDRKPLTKELLEALFSFNGPYLMTYPFDEAAQEEVWGPWQHLLNPTVWQIFALKHYDEQYQAGRPGFGCFLPGGI